jgi:hypothetical protein
MHSGHLPHRLGKTEIAVFHNHLPASKNHQGALSHLAENLHLEAGIFCFLDFVSFFHNAPLESVKAEPAPPLVVLDLLKLDPVCSFISICPIAAKHFIRNDEKNK